MGGIPLADIMALGVIAACVFMSMMRGVIAEVSSLITWVVAFVAAKWLAVPFAEIAFSSVQPQALGVALGFVAVFVLAWAVQRFLRSLLTAAVSAVGLGSVNRALGGVFGAVKGVLLVTLVVLVAGYTDLPQSEGWQASYSIPYFQTLADTIMPYLPYGSGETVAQEPYPYDD
ncbi:CvpA family protein [Neisseria perflava]|uniref:CvpA family protein n=1 Tax=Neisseria perflava TaxID=33053 RepID=UPI00209D9B1D|nr:CvpA family protein [Neisseria perflava]MCP1660944.1 membrane protein required for colicin V production [Neisseria perflava]MCP1771216.1 membrane protein required for colicin V production [Neisseria perflava]